MGSRKISHQIISASLATLLASGVAIPYNAMAASPSEIAASGTTVSFSPIKKTGFISKGIDTSTSEPVRVIVTLTAEPGAVGLYGRSMGITTMSEQSAEAAADSQQDSFIGTAEDNGLDMTVNEQFNTVLNGMEVTIPADQIPALAALPGVASVYENLTYYSIPNVTADGGGDLPLYYDNLPLEQIGVDKAWAAGLTGAGLKVGVIDTGVDYDHPDLQGAYAGGYDAFFQDEDPYEEIPDPAAQNAGTSHGTHVSGTIVGQANNVNAEFAQRGIAPGADLYVYKVLGFDAVTKKSSGSSAQVIAGIEHAVEDGMDVINLSLGSDAEKDVNTPDAIAINNAVLAGVVAVVANGNAGDSAPYYYTMGSPASSQLAISVGAATTAIQSSSVETTATLAADPFTLKLMAWKTGEDVAEYLGSDPIDGVYVGIGDDADYQGIDITGKVALVSRGNLSFVEKIAKAKAHGAKAVILFNGINSANGSVNLSESISGRDGYMSNVLADDLSYIPMFDMSGTQGRALARAVLNDPGTPLQFAFGTFIPYEALKGDQMASFSSRGPDSDANYSIKPDIVAPGNSIFSTYPAYGGNYDEAYARLSGTSMATPHVTGLALLLKQLHPEWTPFDIRAALANTATTMTDGDGKPYDVYSQGAGRVDVSRAIDTPALLETVDEITILDPNLHEKTVVNNGSSASFGMMAPGSDVKTEQLVLKNFSDDAVTYTASIKMHSNLSDALSPFIEADAGGLVVQVEGLNEDDTITAEAQQNKALALKVQPTLTAQPGMYEGEIVLTSNSDDPALHLPFVVHVGDERASNGFGVQDVSASPIAISPNDDGYQDATDVSFKLTASNINYIEMNAYGLDDKLIGTLYAEQQFDDNGNLKVLEPKAYAFPITNEYIDGETDADDNLIVKHLKPGQYKLEVLAVANYNPVIGSYSNIYYAYGLYKVESEGEAALALAAKNLVTSAAVNVTQINNKVLTFPATTGLTYSVTASSRPDYIKDNVLLKRPASSESDLPVTLTARVALTADTKNYLQVDVPVTVPKNTVTENSGGGFVGTPSPPSPTPSPSPSPESTGSKLNPSVPAVVAQGQQQSNVTVATEPKSSAINVTVSDDNLKTALEKAGKSPTAFVMAVENKENLEANFTLSASQTQQLAKAPTGSSLIVNNGDSSVAIPSSVMSHVPAGAGVQVSVKPEKEKSSIFAIGANDKVVGDPIAFELYVLNGSSTTPLTLPGSQRVVRSFTVPGTISANTAGVLYEEDGRVSPVASVLTPQSNGTTIVTVSRPGFSTYTLVSRDVSFTDIDRSWAKSQIEAMARKLIVNGTSETLFSPKKNVTRAEYAAMISRALGLNPSADVTLSDVRTSDWYANEVTAAYAAGIVTGDGAGHFNPNGIITREQMSTMLARAMTLLGVQPSMSQPSHTTYQDVSGFSSYARNSIEAVTAAGIMQGESINGVTYFHADAAVTRDMATVALYKLLKQAKLTD
ncbi:S8 family serine peptidase [Paenibacillus aurantiacus]|uniref:S8 family serine peptidase n=1 Tax=Paenibacillus aurantiacus TaxID=1936118 RepID=A0ABV5KIF5_9BACL